MDRCSPYRATANTAIPVETLLSVPNTKVKVMIQGTNMTMYH